MDWIDVASRLGIPMCCFGLTAWFLKYVYDKSNAMLHEVMERYFDLFKQTTEQMGNLTDAVNENTKVLATMVERMDRDDDGK